MSSLGESIGKFFSKKIEAKKKEEEAKKAGLPRWIMDMPEGSDKDRAIAVHKANQKKDKYADGGFKGIKSLLDKKKKCKK